MKTKRRTNVIKGFTVPPGYSLRISQKDGEVIEKRSGEQSGGQYSFEQIASGINPDWELTQESSGEAYEIPEARQTPQDVPRTKVGPLKMELGHFMHGKEYENHLDEDVSEILSGVSKELRREIFNKHKEDLRGITKESILEHPQFEELGGYTSRAEVMDEVLGVLGRFSKAFDVKEGRTLIYADALSSAGLDAASSFYNGSHRFQETYDFDVHKFLDFCVGSATGNMHYLSRKETPAPHGRWFHSMPKFGERFTKESIKEVMDTLENPSDAREFFATCRTTLPNSERIREINQELEEVNKRLTASKLPIDEYVKTAQRGTELRNEKKDLIYGTYINPFREAVLDGFDVEPFLKDGAKRGDIFGKPGKITEGELEGIEFTFAFVDERIKPKPGSVEIRRPKTSEDTGRSNASGTTIKMSSSSGKAPIGAHEAGHVIEHSHPSILAFNTMAFLAKRIKKGEKTVSLREHYKNQSYRPHEAAFLDDFPREDAYIGRIYCDRIDSQYSSPEANQLNKDHTLDEYAETPEIGSFGIFSSEVVSMGMQKLYSDPGAFAITHPDLFEYVWSLRTNPVLMASKKEG